MRQSVVVLHAHAPAAVAADHPRLQQRRPLAGRRGARARFQEGVGIASQRGSIAKVLLPIDEADMGVRDADVPVLHRHDAASSGPVRPPLDVRLPIDVGAGVARIPQNAGDLRHTRKTPAQLAVGRPASRTRRKLDVLAVHPFRHRHRRPHPAEAVEHEADGVDDGPISVEHHLVPVVVVQADRQPHLQRTARGGVALAADQPCPDPLKLELAEGSFHAEQEPVVYIVGIVDAGLVEDQGIGDAGDPQQLVPVGVVPREPRDFQAENDAHLAGGDAPHQIAEAAAVAAVGSRLALVLVDHPDALRRPAERRRPLAQPILAPRALGVLHDLAKRGLAHVEAGFALQMMRRDLARIRFRHDGSPRSSTRCWRSPQATDTRSRRRTWLAASAITASAIGSSTLVDEGVARGPLRLHAAPATVRAPRRPWKRSAAMALLLPPDSQSPRQLS